MAMHSIIHLAMLNRDLHGWLLPHCKPMCYSLKGDNGEQEGCLVSYGDKGVGTCWRMTTDGRCQ